MINRLRGGLQLKPVEQVVVYSTLPHGYSTLTLGERGEVS
jgi:hypothetical protein